MTTYAALGVFLETPRVALIEELTAALGDVYPAYGPDEPNHSTPWYWFRNVLIPRPYWSSVLKDAYLSTPQAIIPDNVFFALPRVTIRGHGVNYRNVEGVVAEGGVAYFATLESACDHLLLAWLIANKPRLYRPE